MRSYLLLLSFLVTITAQSDWPHYGGGPEQHRYSTLTQIAPANVQKLKVAWTYDTKDAFNGSEMQCQPVVAHGVLYATSPKLRVFALNAATGAEIWSFDTNKDAKALTRTRIRGLMYWERGGDRRIYFASRHWLYALDAKTGKPLPGFGQDGRIDLREGFEGRDPRTLSVGLNTPGVFYRDLLIVGSIVPEGLPSAPGDIRAFDVNTGRQKWAFHTIPHPGEFGYDTWPAEAWKYSGGANAWSGLALDERRGLVYASTGSASYDFYGANRAGDNLFANTMLCLRAATGERVWHFQAVKHDVWDRDFPAPPSLITIRHDRPGPRRRGADGKERPALRARSRHRPAGLSDGTDSGTGRQMSKGSSSPPRRCCQRCRRHSPVSGSPRTSSPSARRQPRRRSARNG